MKVIMTRGLPASGKTWWSKNFQSENPNCIRVNKDNLREMLHNGKWSKSNEKDVLAIRDLIVNHALESGNDVIVDDTNFEQKHIDTVKAIAEKYDAEFEVKDFYTPIEQCIERDSQRSKSVGREVIMSMWRRYLQEPPKQPEYVDGAEHCVLVDIDGTTAKKGDRDIYDGSKCHLDTLIVPTGAIIDMLHAKGTKIIFLSGRGEEHRDVTWEWLQSHSLVKEDTILLMRGLGDKRADYIVKKEIYEGEVKGKYNVEFVLEDRKQVKRMWVQEGLFVFDCNQTDEDF